MPKISRSEQEVVLDVREDLAQGREPFPDIMNALKQVPDGGRLVVYATFKPEPLIAVLAAQGFQSEAEEISDGDWRVTFSRGESPA